MQMEETTETKLSRNVSFNEKVRVVLVPSRIEYKHAKLIPLLWWNGEEFLNFQQTAYSELRLLSTSENINMKEARTRLYQQQSTDKGMDIFTSATTTSTKSTDDDFDNYFTDAEDLSSDDENQDILVNTKKDEEEVETDDIVIRTSFHKVSSLSIISASLQRHEIGQSDEDLAGMTAGTGASPFPKVSSLDCFASAVNSSQKHDTSTSSGAPQESPPPSPSRRNSTWKSTTTSDENFILQLCVLCDKPAALATGPKNRRKNSGKIFTGSTIALYSTILVVAFVVADRYFGTIFV